jgi:hypothetical protein
MLRFVMVGGVDGDFKSDETRQTCLVGSTPALVRQIKVKFLPAQQRYWFCIVFARARSSGYQQGE